MAFLVDSNVLVYAYDARFPAKRTRASKLLEEGLSSGEARLAHQTVTEFVAATTRARRGETALLSVTEATRVAEEILSAFPVIYPEEGIVRLALRGAVAYQLSWYDAHMWAYAEFNGLDPLYSEDFQSGRVYGTVRVLDPFR